MTQQFEQLKALYRESAYNVQRCKFAAVPDGEAYSRACVLVDQVWSILMDEARRCGQLTEACRFVNATYDNR